MTLSSARPYVETMAHRDKAWASPDPSAFIIQSRDANICRRYFHVTVGPQRSSFPRGGPVPPPPTAAAADGPKREHWTRGMFGWWGTEQTPEPLHYDLLYPDQVACARGGTPMYPGDHPAPRR